MEINQEAIDILAAEPCVSWLRARWHERGAQIDDLVNTSRNDFFHLSAHRLQAVTDFRIYGMTMWWLPRVEDFLGRDGLLRQAGAGYYRLEQHPRGKLLLYVTTLELMINADFKSWDEPILLACAQALRWLLSAQEIQ